MPTDPVTPNPRHHPESSSTAQTGTPQNTEAALDKDEVAEYEQLRKLVSREQSLAQLDDFAKWLFPTSAVVGTLGASFGVSGANSLTGTGRALFGWAVGCVAASLALSALARMPLRGCVYIFSRESLASHVDRVVSIRGVLLTVAGILFASGLLLAGLSPLFS